jgi:hypothetical protein
VTTVTLTFDDGRPSQLDCALPILDARGLKATFFLPLVSDCVTQRHHEWRSAAARGHELGNHTIFHPAVATRHWVTEGIALEHYSLDRMRHELAAANRVLHMLDGRIERTFAFPCSNPNLGRPGWPSRFLVRGGLGRTRLMSLVDRMGLDVGSRLVDYTPVVRELFVAARCGGVDVEELPRLPADRHRIRAVEGDARSADELLACVETAVARDCWLVFVFHDVGEGADRFSCAPSAFAALADRLQDADCNVLTFLEASTRLLACPPGV